MKRFHVGLQVEDIEASARFYSALFGAEPTVREADYAKWMLEDPRVNFSISSRADTSGRLHMGIQVEAPEELQEVTARLKHEVGLPLITSNRINTPEQAEQVLASGQADLVSMARPFLADAEIGRAHV